MLPAKLAQQLGPGGAPRGVGSPGAAVEPGQGEGEQSGREPLQGCQFDRDPLFLLLYVQVRGNFPFEPGRSGSGSVCDL